MIVLQPIVDQVHCIKSQMLLIISHIPPLYPIISTINPIVSQSNPLFPLHPMYLLFYIH